MQWIYAQIKDGEIKNTIVADAEFIKEVASQWDFIIDITDMDPQPAIGWLYDGQDFSPPVVEPPP